MPDKEIDIPVNEQGESYPYDEVYDENGVLMENKSIVDDFAEIEQAAAAARARRVNEGK